MAQKTMKVLDICENGCWLVCIKDCTGALNPYRLYLKWYEPGHCYRKKQIGKYADFMSVLTAVRSVYTSIDVLSR